MQKNSYIFKLKKIFKNFIKTLANGFNLVYNEVNLGKRLRKASVTQNYLSSEEENETQSP